MNADQELEGILDLQERERQRRVEEAQRRAAAIPKGVPGECDFCGKDRPRLINGYCASCRDKKRL